ncbi:MAG TPA: hypothetical protein VG847_14675, partial [Chitinophagaceae bacterium]|nr:hypothetical protein [Chitinophagaceae bacterium]
DLTVIDFVGTTEHEYYDSYLERDAIKQVHWFKMRGNRTDVLHPQIAESIEWVRWIPQGELKNYLNNSYSNIREIIVRAGLL